MMSYFQNIEFVSPYFLLLGILPIAWYMWRTLKQRNSDTTFTVSSSSPFSGGQSIRTRLTWLPDLLRLLSLLLFVIALARPQLSVKEEEVKAEGIDIMMAMDISPSMLAMDFEPNRIEVSKALAIEFVNGRKYDRVGLTLYAGEAFTQCPLTTDKANVTSYLRDLNVGILEDGTAIGMGLATAINRLKDSESTSKVIILLSDGFNNTGYIDPETALEVAKSFDIKVYAIGIGNEGLVTMPYRQRGGGVGYRKVESEFDEQLLQKIAQETGGRYFRARNIQDFQQVYAIIDQLEKTEIEVNILTKYSEEFRGFLLWGLGLLLLEILLRKSFLNILN